MNLGWWLHEAADGTLDPMVAAWVATGQAPYEASAKLNDLVGKATFQGIAVGKYTHKTINSIYGGHFNANAKLVADFSLPTAGDPGTLTGTIDGFMQDGQPIGSGWKVELGATAVAVGTVLTFNPKLGATITKRWSGRRHQQRRHGHLRNPEDHGNLVRQLGRQQSQRRYAGWRDWNLPRRSNRSSDQHDRCLWCVNQEADQPKN